MNLTQIDTNLLVVLRAVLAEKSATKAAAKLHVTQSAVSNALARLREIFNDPLVTRGKGSLVPTRRALELGPVLDRALGELEALLGPPSRFDPAAVSLTITIACIDVVAIAVLPALSALFRVRLPRCKLRVVPTDRTTVHALAAGEVDLLVGVPPAIPPGCQVETVYEDEFVCILNARNHSAKKKLSLDAYAALGHIEISLFREMNTAAYIDKAMAHARKKREVLIEVSYLAVAPLIAAQTELVATLPRRIATAFTGALPIRVLPVPLDLPKLRLQQVWHSRSANDPVLGLVRQLIRAATSDPRLFSKAMSAAAKGMHAQ